MNSLVYLCFISLQSLFFLVPKLSRLWHWEPLYISSLCHLTYCHQSLIGPYIQAKQDHPGLCGVIPVQTLFQRGMTFRDHNLVIDTWEIQKLPHPVSNTYKLANFIIKTLNSRNLCLSLTLEEPCVKCQLLLYASQVAPQ